MEGHRNLEGRQSSSFFTRSLPPHSLLILSRSRRLHPASRQQQGATSVALQIYPDLPRFIKIAKKMTVQEKENNEGWFLFMQMDLELLAARSVRARPEFQVVNKYRLPDGNTTAPMDLAYTGWMTVCTCYAVNGSRVAAGTIKPLGSNSSG
ncbi:hypothetical protein EV1_038520 [Malus domestica]